MTLRKAHRAAAWVFSLGIVAGASPLVAQEAGAPTEAVIVEPEPFFAEGDAEAVPEISPGTAQSLQTISVDPLRTEAPPAVTTDNKTAQLEEIVVTAQKRGVQAVKDIPVSISVVDEKLIRDWGITDVREAMLFVPNVKVEQAGFFASPRVRGFSFNNNNKAFEPPAGIALEGVPYGRVEYFAAGLFDTQRIEVLRGPQGTTFGKNTTAGLLNLLSNDPTDTLEGFIDVQGGDYERQRFEAAVGGPLIEDVVNFRIAAVSDDRRGFVYNTTSEVSPDADKYLRGDLRDGVRLKLQFPDLAIGNIKLTYESVDLTSLGTGIEIIQASETVKSRLRAYDPNADFIPRNFISSIDSPDRRETSIDSWVLDWGTALGEWNLSALAGHSDMETVLTGDVDFTPAKALVINGQDSSPTTTAELRLMSPNFDGLFGLGGSALGNSDILVGGFYQKTAIEDSLVRFNFYAGPLLDLTIAAETGGLLDGIFGIGGGLIPPLPLITDEQDSQYFDQQSRTSALFSQVQWTFVPDWTLQLGARYSREEKRAHWDQVFDSPTSVLMATQGLEEFSADESQSLSKFQPKISLNWQPSSNMSWFVHWARAFKSGGFNAFAFSGARDELTYEPEYSTEWGADLKSTFFNRRMQLNLSLYRMDIDDFQVLTREPDSAPLGLGVSKVENAATARAQGLEGDVVWLATDWLRLMAAVGLNDTEYLNFKTNDCPAGVEDSDGDGDARCDASGKPFAFAPRVNGTLGVNLIPVADFFGTMIEIGAVAEYQTWAYLDIDLDDRKVQDEFWRYRLSIGIRGLNGWSFKLIGENLTNEATYIRQGDVSPDVIVGALEPPRMIFGQFRWTF